jgi:anti-sigma regulatory factor (Ser/Thr protein kinase)
VGQDDLVASAAYQPEPTAAAAARHFVRDTLQEWLFTGASTKGHELIDDAVLLTSELVTNAVVHAGTPVQVTCRLASSSVEVMVSDGHPARLVPESAHGERGPADQTGGRGLRLPAALAAEWGVTYGRTAKGVWFRLGLAGAGTGLGGIFAGGQDGGLYEELEAATGARTALAAALHAVAGANVGHGVGPGAGANVGHGAAPGAGSGPGSTGEPGYRVLLARTVEAARATVRADAAFALMADEDGDLRLQAAAGTFPAPADRAGSGGLAGTGAASVAAVRASARVAPAVVTVPFVVDGRVTGLLAAASATPGRFNDEETARLQRLADTWGAALQRAWLFELDRTRRARIAAIAAASGLLTGGLGREEVLSMAGRAVVPRLAAWCAVLTLSRDGGLHPAYARHADSSRTDALIWLLDRTCEAAPAASSWLAKGSPPGRRRPLTAPYVAGAPTKAHEFADDVAWCFPLGQPDGDAGVFVIGGEREDRLPREVAALATDVALRVGLALGSVRLVGKG